MYFPDEFRWNRDARCLAYASSARQPASSSLRHQDSMLRGRLWQIACARRPHLTPNTRIPCGARFGNYPPDGVEAGYIKATFETPAGLADEAAGILVANGALGCAVERGGRAGPRSRRPVKLEAYFTTLRPAKLRAIRSTMRAAGMLTDSDRDAAPQSIVDPGWATMWQSRFEPLPIGERFLIVPPWNRSQRARPHQHHGSAGTGVRHRASSDHERRAACDR